MKEAEREKPQAKDKCIRLLKNRPSKEVLEATATGVGVLATEQ